MTSPLQITAAAGTHVGLVRRRNEDSHYLGDFLVAVADGLGGHVAGDLASGTAIEALKPYDREVDPADLADTLGTAVASADRALRRKVREQPDAAGMGTTMVALLRSGTAAVVANVGDSRAYLMRAFRSGGDASLLRITEDHTYQHLVAAADTFPELPGKLARFLDGRKDGRSPDLTAVRLSPGDRILLCTDGLSSYVPEPVIQKVLGSAGSPDQVTEALIASALDRGAPDNVTVLVLEIRGGAATDAAAS
ncbi:hypothetical protein GCM10010112_55120 [Actinoplanes lobatus]|uniref:Serine/threonine protein phosphatase PrpC n=1 Tax=Actinoplanes lobatus TaxID=113568 RepID=A0A7W7HEY5_9ACTN|nr:protein phosphatase 2C domain-containing protein [Actinoplanes lobatus]MBB4749270.1 serine/threonine protein phosphatase PrpC [Actinoplanes lobatus]GGN80027.1 hypothetical protein GCM10010112_55120 [Actinoplanes lobatus]GIE40209.1 hypothetical protein Alo02nite_31070 [Actinoplanes lobatus]